MCGIAGIINLNNEKTILAPHIAAMTRQMKHRGPDDEGFVLFSETNHPLSGDFSNINNKNPDHIRKYYDKTVRIALGHRRLSIIDLTNEASQPFHSPSGNHWIVFNGEIYNYKEIKKDLISKNYKFRSDSDTEVLLNAFIEWGIDCLERLNGMFAFCIYVKNENQIYFGRDRIGIKPFYYTIQNHQFIFGSEIKTIIASGLYKPEVNWEGLWHNMSYTVAPRPMTAFKDVFALEQAHWMKIDCNTNTIIKQRYWNIPLNVQDNSLSEKDSIKLITDKLTTAVNYRLNSDVEVGTFMSGGIDSSLISAIAAKSQSGIKAFTLGFDTDSNLNEINEAQATAKIYKMNHITKIVNPFDILDNLNDIVLRYEEPSCTLAPNFEISKLVSENNIKVVLNGLGGDELFGGYPLYNRVNTWQKLRKINFISKLFPYGISHKIDKAKQFSSINNIHDFYSTMYTKLHDFEKNKIFKDLTFDSKTILRKTYFNQSLSFKDNIELFNFYDLTTYIGNHHVYRLDQFTMNFSLEGRVPFLDHNVVETAFKIPSSLKVKNNQLKYILKQVAKPLISNEAYNMPKKGFRFPLKEWINNELKSEIEQTLNQLKNRKEFNSTEIENTYQKYKSTEPEKIMMLYMTELWFQKFIDPGTQAVSK